jgi:hypothetical protein
MLIGSRLAPYQGPHDLVQVYTHGLYSSDKRPYSFLPIGPPTCSFFFAYSPFPTLYFAVIQLLGPRCNVISLNKPSLTPIPNLGYVWCFYVLFL